MKLRCVRGGFGSPFVAGRYYDVVEIKEMPIPGHVMVRMPNGHWPKPSDRRWFGWHPEEFFASPRSKDGLPALSCGYRLEERNCYGVIIPVSVYKNVPRFDSALERSIDQFMDTPLPIWYLRYTNVWTGCCWPEGLERSFRVVGVDHDRLGRHISYKRAADAVGQVLSDLGLAELSKGIDDLELEFWYKIQPPGGRTWPNYKHYD